MDLREADCRLFAPELADAPSAGESGDRSSAVATRGTRWVLRSTGVLAVFVASAVALLESAYQLAAERTATRAARAGALEATLPRATRESVRRTIQSRLDGLVQDAGQWQLSLQRNGVPVSGPLQARGGDRLSVTLTIPGSAAMPHWLRAIRHWRGDSPLEAHAERLIPDSRLPAVRGAFKH